MQRKYNWPHTYKDIKETKKNCEQCLKARGDRSKTAKKVVNPAIFNEL